jgi:glycyl-tRNA synthetase beta chain
MTESSDLLIEIGTEELPPKALLGLSQAFTKGLADALSELGLQFSDVRGFCTPRRLAVMVSALANAQADRQTERRGPAVAAAFDPQGRPTKAAEGFARSCGVDVEQLETLATDKGEWLAFRQKQRGQATISLVPGAVEKALAGLPIPKRMRWGAGTVEFVRPVHWVVMLYGDQEIRGEILGVTAGRSSRGHRFHAPGPLELAEAGDYLARLRDNGRVYADFEERREKIRGQVEQLAGNAGKYPNIDEALLDEVTALVEWPVAIMGSFDAKFLAVPSEVLIKTMQEHQKYFSVSDREGTLVPHFITISNIDSQNPEQVRVGNERVIRPRFSDASFFWEQDLRAPLESHLEGLKGVIFEERLGTLYDKTQRVLAVALQIGELCGWDPHHVERAALLCKCDLLSQMVGEFPSLQGTMGRYYASRGGETEEVAAAVEEHYLPRHAGDRLPTTHSGQAVAIADRLDSLTGIFAIGQKPSGVKDPFGLRRAALGVLRILIETPLDLDLMQLLRWSAGTLGDRCDAAAAIEPVFEYIMERLRAYYSDQGIGADVVESVLARRPTRPSDFDRRVRAVTAFRKLPEASSLAAANKRIRNILRKAGEEGEMQSDPALLEEASEKELTVRVKQLAEEIEPLLQAGDYTLALSRLATLRDPVDRFFDEVMVLCEDDTLRSNRLALLTGLENLFLRVADLSRLQ